MEINNDIVNIDDLLSMINNEWGDSKITKSDQSLEARKVLKQLNSIANKATEMGFKPLSRILHLTTLTVLKGKEVELDSFIRYFYETQVMGKKK